MADLTGMKYIGKEMASKLNGIGIFTAEQLTDLGAKEAFYKLKMQYPNVCLVHLYTLEGAIQNTEFNSLSEATKADLKKYSDSLQER